MIASVVSINRFLAGLGSHDYAALASVNGLRSAFEHDHIHPDTRYMSFVRKLRIYIQFNFEILKF